MAAPAIPAPPAGFSWVYYGRNSFLDSTDLSFAASQQVTLSFGVDTLAAPAQRYGPYLRAYIEQFFPLLQASMLFARPVGMTNAVWANTIAHEHFNGAVKEFPVGVWNSIHHYLTSNDLSIMESPWTTQANPLHVDPKDVWILADFLQGHAIKNVIAHEFFNNRSFTDPNGFQTYLIDRPLIEYCFDNQLWATQFGRAILYIMNGDIYFNSIGNIPDTADHDVLPSYIEDLFRVPNQDFNYMPWYYNLCHLLLIEERRPRDGVGAEETNTEDSIQYYCGVTHHHPNEPRCGRAPSPPGSPMYYLDDDDDDEA